MPSASATARCSTSWSDSFKPSAARWSATGDLLAPRGGHHVYIVRRHRVRWLDPLGPDGVRRGAPRQRAGARVARGRVLCVAAAAIGGGAVRRLRYRPANVPLVRTIGHAGVAGKDTRRDRWSWGVVAGGWRVARGAGMACDPVAGARVARSRPPARDVRRSRPGV